MLALFPGITFQEKPKGYWLETLQADGRNFFQKFAEQHGFNPASVPHWNNVTQEQIAEYAEVRHNPQRYAQDVTPNLGTTSSPRVSQLATISSAALLSRVIQR